MAHACSPSAQEDETGGLWQGCSHRVSFKPDLKLKEKQMGTLPPIPGPARKVGTPFKDDCKEVSARSLNWGVLAC